MTPGGIGRRRSLAERRTGKSARRINIRRGTGSGTEPKTKTERRTGTKSAAGRTGIGIGMIMMREVTERGNGTADRSFCFTFGIELGFLS